METNNTDEFDWGEKGEVFWRGIQKAAATRSELALKFVVGKAAGKSNAEAARCAGAGGQPNAAGYRLSRANQVQRLFAVLQAETGDEVGHVDGAEAKRILSHLARGSDPSVRIRAVEALAKLEERERELDAQRAEEGDPLKTLQRIADGWPLLAAVIAKRDGWAPGKVKIPARSKAAALADIREMLTALDDIQTDEGEANGRSFATS